MFQFIANGICLGAVFAIVGLGFGLIYTTTRVFHLAHGGIYILTGYALWLATSQWNLPLMLAIPLALIVAAAAGVFLDWSVYQPLARRSASTAVIIISSIGALIILKNIFAVFFGNQTKFLRADLERTMVLGPITLTYVQVAQLIVGIIVIVAFWLFLKHTRVGQLSRAVSDDETLALVLGVRVPRVRLLAFALGSVFAGIGSILVSLDVGLDPQAAFPAVLTAAVVCIIGGLRNFLAPAAGGLILGVLQYLVVWQTSAKWQGSVTFGLLILFLLTRRQGIFGVEVRAEEA